MAAPTDDPDPPTPGDEAQVNEVRDRLLADAAAAEIDQGLVREAIDRAVLELSQAPVRSFVGILVERAVRDQLGLRPRLS